MLTWITGHKAQSSTQIHTETNAQRMVNGKLCCLLPLCEAMHAKGFTPLWSHASKYLGYFFNPLKLHLTLTEIVLYIFIKILFSMFIKPFSPSYTQKKGTKAVTGAVPFKRYTFVPKWSILVPRRYMLVAKVYILVPKRYKSVPFKRCRISDSLYTFLSESVWIVDWSPKVGDFTHTYTMVFKSLGSVRFFVLRN